MALVGRAAETRRIRSLISDVRERGTALVVRGEAGVGKSALLDYATGRARASGLRVLTTSGVQCETHLPYAGLHQLLYPIRDRIALIPQRQRAALEAALGGAEPAAPDVFLVGLAALNLIAEAAETTPVLVVVEDSHWLDISTSHVLAFLARRLESEPIVLLAAARDGFSSSLVDSELPELVLAPLGTEAAVALLDAHAPDLEPALRRRVLAEAAGNPLALTELPRTAAAIAEGAPTPGSWIPLTERLERAFTIRLSGLPEPTRTLLQIAALNDSPSLTETMSATARLAGGEPGTGDLTAAVAARLIDVDRGEIRFRHPLMRSAIHQSMSLPERHAAHAALADVIADQEDRRIWHRAAATALPDESVAAQLQAAAVRAEHRGGIGAAVMALDHAARLSQDPASRADRLLRAAELAVELGSREAVGNLLDEASRCDLTTQQRARVVWLRGGFDEGLRGRTADTWALAGLAETVAADGDRDLAVRILWSAAQRCFWTEPGGRARQHVVDVAENLGLDEHDPWLLAILAYAAPIDRGAVVIERLNRIAATPGRDARMDRMLGTGALMVGSFDLAQKLSAVAAAGLRPQGRLGLLARALGAEASSAVQLGDLSVAIPAAEESGRLARETTQPFLHGLIRAIEAAIGALRGDLDRVRVLTARAEQDGLPVGARPVLARAQMARGLAALGAGRFDEAYTQLRRLHDPADPCYQVALRCFAIADLVDAAAHCGRGAAIADIMREMESAALKTPSPVLHAGLRFARALLADDTEAEQFYTAALSADLTGWPFIRARTQLAYGEWLRRQRRVADSRPHLRAARETFDALGVIPWSDRARQELRASGETSRSRNLDARDQLTAQELQIARMAASGLTNREIGQKLYLSHRTISTHLHRIFPKLGVASRSELASSLNLSPDLLQDADFGDGMTVT
ncbi:DNA-binding CsgD family transcriptional regulator [Catenulispora sp. GP43]|uniref:helix-turn-helix transcriptional regulator n=1 Tax=Catenulispora sp. GP43 TaxID=3156263 RepID=UPI003513178E